MDFHKYVSKSAAEIEVSYSLIQGINDKHRMLNKDTMDLLKARTGRSQYKWTGNQNQ